MMIGLPAAVAELAASAATAPITTRSASSAPVVLRVITPSSCAELVCSSFEWCSPGRLLRLDEPIHRGVQGDGHAVLLRLADERSRDQVDLGRSVVLEVLEHGRVVGTAAPGCEHVHLPWVVVQLDARRGRHGRALVDEVVDEVTEVGRALL